MDSAAPEASVIGKPYDLFEDEPLSDAPSVPMILLEQGVIERDGDGPDDHKIDTVTTPQQGADLGQLSELLEHHARELPEAHRAGERGSRPVLLKALVSYRNAWLDCARALLEYKRSLSERVWMKSAKAIAEWMGRTDRTVRQLIADYEITVQHRELVEGLQGAGYPIRRHQNLKLLKAAVSLAEGNPDLDNTQVIQQVVKFVDPREEHYEELTAAERRFWRLRVAIRTATNGMPSSERLDAIAKAIGEEAYHVWNTVEPFTLAVTPHKGIFTLDGQKLKAAGVSE